MFYTPNAPFVTENGSPLCLPCGRQAEPAQEQTDPSAHHWIPFGLTPPYNIAGAGTDSVRRRLLSLRLTLDRSAAFVPVHGLRPEIGLVGHVAGERGVMAEDCVFHNRPAGPYGVEEIPQMRLDVVVVGPF